MKLLVKIGAVFFVAWGLIHVIGGASILAALGDGVDSGYATYRNSSGSYDPLAGSVLGYFAYLLVCIGLAVAAMGATMNWKNSQSGLAVNTAVIAVTEIGLVYFLVVPGFVSWSEASIGFAPFFVAAAASGIACRSGATT